MINLNTAKAYLHYRLLLTAIFCLACFAACFAVAPTITGFSPQSDPVGTSVTITGTGFNTVAAQNVVFFGATQATVTAASTTSLTVTVPAGSTYQYITVTCLGINLTAYSATPFIVTGPGNIAFTNPLNPVTATNPYSVVIADVDLDGRPDLVVTSTAGNVVSVFPNTSTGGATSFGTRLDFATGTGPYMVVTGDIDGDGKPDLAVANQSTNTVSILLNTSTGPGNFGFATHADFTASSNPSSISIYDMDGDGKPDVVAANQGTTVVSILRNTSTPGTASFATAVNVSVGAGTRPIAVGVGDFDGDGKADLAVTNYNGNSVSILPNTSIPGTISFGTRIDITLPGSTNPDAIAIGDLDGDGLPDLAVSSYAGEAIFLFRNTSTLGAISFDAYTTYSIPSTTFDITMGDIDGDGSPDLATITNSTNSIYVLKNTSSPGNISFTSSSFATGTYPKSVKIGDLNGDGLPDMVETNWTSGTVGVFIQNTPPQGSLTSNGPICNPGAGTLTFTATVGTGPFTIAYYDGLADRTATGVVSGTPFNPFTDPVTSSTTYSLVSITDATGLVRSSGFTVGEATITVNTPPNASASNTGPYVLGQTIQLNALPTGLVNYAWAGPNAYSHSGASASPTIASATTAMQGNYDVTVTDANNCTASATTNVLVSDPAITITNFSPTSGPIGTSVTITGTGYSATPANDIVFFGATQATVTAASTTSLTVTVPLEATYYPITATNIATHLTAYSATPFGVTLNGSTSFLPEVAIATITQVDGVVIGDIDGDGKADVVDAGLNSATVAIYHNNSTPGNVSFASALTYATGSSGQRPMIGDLDGDGKPDLVVVNFGGASVSVYHNTYTTVGTPSFATQVTYAVGSSPNGVAIADIDGDGIADLVVTNGGSGTISVLHGLGNASFSGQVTFAAGSNPQGVIIEDIDGDGKPDIVIANYGSNTISVYHNNYTTAGTPSFAAQATYATGLSPNGLSIGDIDGDGKPDVVVANQAGGTVSVLHNNYTTTGTPSFAAQVSYAVGSGPFTVKIADVDGDGKADLVSSNNSSGTASVLKNNYTTTGTPSFAAQVTYTTASSCNYIAVGDIDGDGYPDLVTSNYGNNTFSVLLQSITYTWTGTTSTAWATTTNWSPTAPVGGPNSCSADVIIASAGRYPVIASAVQVGNLQMNAGTQLTLISNISVCKNLTGGTGTSATVTGSGLIVMNGSAAQAISGYTALQELQISNSSGVVMQSSSKLDVSTALDLQTGNFDATSGTLTFKSTSSSNVGIIDNFSEGNSGTLTGNIIAERYYDASSTYNQHYFGSPVHSAPLSQFGASGTPGYVTDLNCDETHLTNGSNYGNVFSFNESNGATCAMDEWSVVASGNATDGQGFSVVKAGAGTLTLTGAANLGSTYTLSNLANSGWSSQTLQTHTYYSGWQLLSNPYLATMDITSTNSGFDNQVQVWNTTGPYAGSYQPSNVVAPFQGFLVHKTNAGGGGSFTLNASNRVRTAQQFFDQSAEQLNLVATNTTTSLLDQITVGFNQNATDSFDAQMDADKIPGALNRHTIYSVNNGQWMSKNILHSILTTSTVPVGFEPGATGSYTIAFNGINTFDATSYVYLEDQATNTMVNARNGNYTFTADSSDSRNRFVLHFTPPTQIITVEATCTAPGIINITQPGTANWTYTLTDANNATVTSGMLNQSQPVSVGVAAGMYTLTLTDANNYTAVKVISVTGPETISAAFNMSATVVQTQQPVTLNATGQGAVSYQWNLGNGTTETGANVTATYTQPGVYNLILTVINGAGCSSSTSKTITVNGATGLANVTGADNLSIWSHDNNVYVDFSRLLNADATVIIYDVLGQEISNEHYTGNTIYQKEINGLDVAYLIVMVKNADKITAKKVFITNFK